jgi:cytosine/adenosine deaminase-related metal-dependent hydrolase
LILDGRLERGLEVILEGGAIQDVRPHAGPSEPWVLSPAFVNAHSHLEYRGLQDSVQEFSYWPWIRELTRQKAAQDLDRVRNDCLLAARENREAGVGLIGEHSDRPFSGEALREAGLMGVIFQEVITFFERSSREEKLAEVDRRSSINREAFGGLVHLAPHSLYTVDRQTLREIGASGEPFSLHLAETPAETEFLRDGKGVIADFYQLHGVPFEATGLTAFETAESLGLVRQGAQLVHCCDLSQKEVVRLAASGAAVAHCPRSNLRLGCPLAPIREMLDAGVPVGLGLDSAASSGPIDMLAEMRAALQVAEQRGRPISTEEIWRMATSGGAESLRLAETGWKIAARLSTPLIRISMEGAAHTLDLLQGARYEHIEHVY